MKDTNFYVYALIDPTTNLPFYIGKGKNDRIKRHVKDVKRGNSSNNSFKDNYIKHLLNQGLEPIEQIIKEGFIDENDAYDFEETLIYKYGLRVDNTGILTNIARISNRPPARIGADNGMFGKTHTDEAKKLIGEASKGRNWHKWTPEEKQRMAEISPEVQPTRIQTSIYDKNGKFIKEFVSIHRAAVFLNTGHTNLSLAASKFQHWLVKDHYVRYYKVEQLDMNEINKLKFKFKAGLFVDGVCVKSWNTLKEITSELKIGYNVIKNILEGTHKPTGKGAKYKNLDLRYID